MSVSVIIPNYNNAIYLERCLNSVVDDPVVSEVIVYDNASTDKSTDVVVKINHPKIRLIEGPLNIGASRARHAAIQEARQPFLALLDSDDYLAERTLCQCYNQAMLDDLDICCATTVIVSLDEQNFIPMTSALSIMPGKEAVFKTLGRWQFDPGAGVIRKSVYLQASQCFDFYGYSDDELLSRRIVAAARRVGGGGGTYYYRLGQRTPTAEQIAMRLLTLVRSLALAVGLDQPGTEPVLRASRNHLVRGLIAAHRAWPYDPTQSILQKVGTETNSLKVPWFLRDLPFRVALKAIRVRTAG